MLGFAPCLSLTYMQSAIYLMDISFNLVIALYDLLAQLIINVNIINNFFILDLLQK